VHPRDVIDNLALASRLAGSAYPDEFLAAFPSSEWDGNSFVCSGLGGIRRPEATKRLMRLLGHHDKWVRIAAAAALQRHRHRALRSALLAALDDPEDLVRYHVEERLSELGDR
jgi:HEAT repeat protein